LGERERLEESCRIMGELLTFGEDMAKNMTVDPQRMKANLDLLKGLMLSESVMIEFGKKMEESAGCRDSNSGFLGRVPYANKKE
jgi:adenylosuccinate lyase